MALSPIQHSPLFPHNQLSNVGFSAFVDCRYSSSRSCPLFCSFNKLNDICYFPRWCFFILNRKHWSAASTCSWKKVSTHAHSVRAFDRVIVAVLLGCRFKLRFSSLFIRLQFIRCNHNACKFTVEFSSLALVIAFCSIFLSQIAIHLSVFCANFACVCVLPTQFTCVLFTVKFSSSALRNCQLFDLAITKS